MKLKPTGSSVDYWTSSLSQEAEVTRFRLTIEYQDVGELAISCYSHEDVNVLLPIIAEMCPRLESLKFNHPEPTVIKKGLLKNLAEKCPLLSRLKIRAEGPAIEEIKYFESVDAVSVTGILAEKVWLRAFPKMHRLSELFLTDISHIDLASLTRHVSPTLRVLALNRLTDPTEYKFECLSQLDNVRQFRLNIADEFEAESFLQLCQMKSLERLQLGYMKAVPSLDYVMWDFYFPKLKELTLDAIVLLNPSHLNCVACNNPQLEKLYVKACRNIIPFDLRTFSRKYGIEAHYI